MADRAEALGEQGVLYDIHLGRLPPESLRSQYPSMTVHTTGAQTVLRVRVEGLGQIEEFLHQLWSVGLILTDVHRISPARHDRIAEVGETAGTEAEDADGGRAGSATYEIRVAGELGEPLLRYLRSPHYAVPEQTLVRLAAASADLHRFLRACTESGASIERIRRVGPPPRPGQSAGPQAG
jgi:hypothetical protein